MRRLAFALLVGVALTSCSPNVISPTQIEYRDRIEYRNQYVRDTIYESLTEHIYEKNDTIFQEVVKYKYKEYTKYDTIYINHTDSIHITDVVVKEKELTRIQKTLMYSGAMAIIAIIIGLFLFIKNKIKR